MSGAEDVAKVHNVLVHDADLSVDFWAALEKAILKAEVTSFTIEDRANLLRLVADDLKGGADTPAFRWIYWGPIS